VLLVRDEIVSSPWLEPHHLPSLIRAMLGQAISNTMPVVTINTQAASASLLPCFVFLSPRDSLPSQRLDGVSNRHRRTD
jgi:hypothetical protein